MNNDYYTIKTLGIKVTIRFFNRSSTHFLAPIF